eukprot:COSAG05_NODE_2919_length_2511_cov_1.360282_3_plen_52_part_00
MVHLEQVIGQRPFFYEAVRRKAKELAEAGTPPLAGVSYKMRPRRACGAESP